MVEVSNLYKERIYAPERTIQAKVSFELLDVGAYDALQNVLSPTEAPISRKFQAINKIREMSHKYATFEKDYFQLDGSFHIPPTSNESDSELGWWSQQLSNANNEFVEQPTLVFSFAGEHNAAGLTITFDKLTNEYASDFRIEALNGLGELIVNEVISGNSSPVYVYDTPIEKYTAVAITIIKWAKPYRRARIVEVDFGIIFEYTNDKLISLKILEEMDLLASTVPSNEMEFTLDNSDQRFNILNPEGIYRFLTINQEMTAQLGLLIGEEKYEWIPMGRYFLTEWTVEEGALTSTFVGRDAFTKLELVEYTNLLQVVTLYDLAVDVLTQAGIENYIIDEKLKDVATIGFTEPIKVRDALQLIAMAGRSIVRQGRDGSIIFQQFEKLTFETGYLTFAGANQFAGITYPQVYVDYGFQGITFDEAFDVPKVSLNEPVKRLIIKKYTGLNNVTEMIFENAMIKKGVGYEIDNPLINSDETATAVAEWMFNEYSLIAEYEANWRQNPALECGMITALEDNFDRKKKARITKQEFNFEGYLDGVTNAKGGV